MIVVLLFLFSVTGLDVLRTDRTLEFYEKPSNLAKLWDILAVYSWLDPEVGYCQGYQFSILAITLEASGYTISKCHFDVGLEYIYQVSNYQRKSYCKY